MSETRQPNSSLSPPSDAVRAWKGLRVLIVIPAYNESASIASVIESVRQYCPYADLVVVNDGSTDATAALARENSAKVLDLPINVGIGGAVQCGFRLAVAYDYDVCVQIDGDGQHDPRYVSAMLDRMVAEQADLVVGSRFLSTGGFQSTAARRFGIRIIRCLIAVLTGTRISDPTSGMRAYGRQTMRALARYYPQEYPEPECVFMLSRGGYRVVEVPVQMKERLGGSSSIRAFASVLYVIKVVIAIALHMTSVRLAPKEVLK